MLLADSSEEEYNGKHSLAYHHHGRTSTVPGILTFFKRLAGHGFQSLHHRFITWTKPDTNSLLLATLTDFARSKSELVAENALLRQQLIILRRQVKRPACTRTDRMLLVLLASIVRTWKQALFIVQPETRLALASSRLQTLLEVQVEGSFSRAETIPGDRRLDWGRWQGTTDSGEQNAFVVSSSSWAFTFLNAPCRST